MTMYKFRVYDLAKELQIQPKQVLEILARAGVTGKVPSSQIEVTAERYVRQTVAQMNNPLDTAPTLEELLERREDALRQELLILRQQQRELEQQQVKLEQREADLATSLQRLKEREQRMDRWAAAPDIDKTVLPMVDHLNQIDELLPSATNLAKSLAMYHSSEYGFSVALCGRSLELLLSYCLQVLGHSDIHNTGPKVKRLVDIGVMPSFIGDYIYETTVAPRNKWTHTTYEPSQDHAKQVIEHYCKIAEFVLTVCYFAREQLR